MAVDVYLLKKRSREGELGKSFERMKSFYGMILTNESLVFDVGANLGNYADVYLELGAKVIAVEPQEYCMKFMQLRFGKSHPQLTYVAKGLDEKPGKATLRISGSHTLSSMSDNWIQAVKDSGRFSNENWERTVEVDVTTLEQLIEQFGRPDYCKIDVEGFEYNVLRGLSSPVNYVSFEFTYECFNASINCMEHLCTLGEFHFNFVKGDYEGWESENWMTKDEFIDYLKSVTGKGSMGDIFAKHIS